MNSQMAVYQTAQMNDMAKRESEKAALEAESARIRTSKPLGNTAPTHFYSSNR